MRVAAVDAIAEVKCPETNLNGSKTVRIFEKFSENGEIPLVSDRYDLPSSPKETTRTKKQKSQNPVYYRITWPAKWKTSPEIAAALPAFHAQSGADNTGCFSGKRKLHAGKLSAFEGSDLTPRVAIMASIEKFVCQPCLPETDM
ncbi:hypothetical protein pdam_00005516 [Pocillopora damicornis]|uniref:Uncharacterized protein n=1 Tax=Pocillopora damicornis TaxID=46731 RepID=A0A3M6TAQ0_POCDA|nr:hypothetical protein pdam_00005516 [Pocillopora damicornis]